MAARSPRFTLKIQVEHTLPVGFTRAVNNLSRVLGAQMSELTDAVADLDAALNAFINSEADEDAQAELDRATIATLEAQIAELEDGKQASIDELRKVRDALQAQADANTGDSGEGAPADEPATDPTPDAPADETPDDAAPPVEGATDPSVEQAPDTVTTAEDPDA